MSKKKILTAAALIILGIGTNAFSQEKGKTYFVEGFHGGLYGHYPLETYTTYLMNLLDEHPEWKFSIEIEPETWDSVRVSDPSGYARFKEAVIEGSRIEFTNASYAQPYCYNISGESLIRQFEYGIKKLNGHFPGIRFDTYAVEEPCFTSALPQVLRGFGISYASIKNPNTTWGGYSAPHGGELVNWIAPDGSSVLASPRHAIEELGSTVWDTKANGLYASYYEDAFKAGFKHPVGMCYQDAGWTYGLWLDHNKAPYRGEDYVTWREYFENIAKDVKPEDYVYHQEDIRGGLVWGSQVLQKLAQEVREAENGITMAEKMGVIANIAGGYRYDQADVDEAWRCLLLSQHHDSWIVPYNNLKNQGSWADWICGRWTGTTDRVAKRVIGQAQMSFMPHKRGAQGPVAIRIYNTTGSSRKEVVSMRADQIPAGAAVTLANASGKTVESWFGVVDGDKTLVFVAEAPAFGYATYTVSWTDSKAEVVTPRPVSTVENDMYRITFNPEKGGTIKSIYSKKDKYEVVSSDTLAFGEMKGFFYNEGVFHSSADAPASVTLIEDNPLEKKVRICGTIASHPFIETITLRKGDVKIGIDMTINWQGSPGIGTYSQDAGGAYGTRDRSFYDESGKLNIYFPTPAKGGKLIKNAPFDVCESRLATTQFSNYEDIQHNIILNWVDLEGKDGKSIAILSDHTTAYVNGGDKPLGLTLQFSGNGLWGRDYKITGPTNVSMALVPHVGDWDTVENADRCWNEPLLVSAAMGVNIEDKGFINLGECGYQICAAHIEGDGILVRIYNATGDARKQKVTIDSRFSSAQEVDLNGNVLASVSLNASSTGKSFTTAMPRFGFKTFILKK